MSLDELCKPRILIVDDNDIFRKRSFEYANYVFGENISITCTKSASDAVIACAKRDYDLILADLSIPNFDKGSISNALLRLPHHEPPYIPPKLVLTTDFPIVRDGFIYKEDFQAVLDKYISGCLEPNLKFMHTRALFPSNPKQGGFYLISEQYDKGNWSNWIKFPGGIFDPKVHSSAESCVQDELWEELRLEGVKLFPLYVATEPNAVGAFFLAWPKNKIRMGKFTKQDIDSFDADDVGKKPSEAIFLNFEEIEEAQTEGIEMDNRPRRYVHSGTARTIRNYFGLMLREYYEKRPNQSVRAPVRGKKKKSKSMEVFPRRGYFSHSMSISQETIGYIARKTGIRIDSRAKIHFYENIIGRTKYPGDAKMSGRLLIETSHFWYQYKGLFPKFKKLQKKYVVAKKEDLEFRLKTYGISGYLQK